MVSLLGMLLLPETPNYLLTKDGKEGAESALAKLRGSTCNLDDEIDKMIAFKEKNHVEPLVSLFLLMIEYVMHVCKRLMLK